MNLLKKKTNQSSTTQNINKAPPSWVFLISTVNSSDEKLLSIEWIFKIISELQCLCLIFDLPFTEFTKPKNESLSLYFDQISSYITFRDYTNDVITKNETLYRVEFLIIAYLILWIIGIILVLIFKSNYKDNKRKMLIALNTILTIHCLFAWLFIHRFFIKIQYLHRDYSNAGVKGIYRNFALILNSFLAFFGVRYSYDHLYSENALTQNSSAYEVVNFFYKLFMMIFLETLTGDIKLILPSVLAFIMLLIKGKTLFQLPFHSAFSQKIFLGTFSVQVAFYISSLIAIPYDNTSTVFYLGVIGSPFVMGIMMSYFKSIIKKFLFISDSEIKTELDVHKKVLAIRYLSQYQKNKSQANKEYETYLYGFYTQHRNICENIECSCRQIIPALGPNAADQPLPKKIETFSIFFGKTIQDIYLKSILAIPNSVDLVLSYSYLLSEQNVIDQIKALSLLHNVQKKRHISSEMKAVRYRLLKQLELSLDRSNKGVIDVKYIYDYYEKQSKFKGFMTEAVQKYNQLWSRYFENSPNIRELMNLNNEIDCLSTKIEKIFKKITVEYERKASPEYLLYSIYLGLIRSQPSTSQHLLKTYEQKEYLKLDHAQAGDDLINIDQIFVNTIAIVVNMEKSFLGRMESVSHHIHDLGYDVNELVGRDCDSIMSSWFKARHRKYLLDHVDTDLNHFRSSTQARKGTINLTQLQQISNNGGSGGGNGTTIQQGSIQNKKSVNELKGTGGIIYNQRKIYVQQKNGFSIPAYAYIAPLPYLCNRFMYMGLLKPIEYLNEFILIDEEGRVDGFSERVGIMLNLRLKDQNRPIDLEKVCKKSEFIMNIIANIGIRSTFQKYQFFKKQYIFQTATQQFKNYENEVELRVAADMMLNEGLNFEFNSMNERNHYDSDGKHIASNNSTVIGNNTNTLHRTPTMTSKSESTFVFNVVLEPLPFKNNQNLYVMHLNEMIHQDDLEDNMNKSQINSPSSYNEHFSDVGSPQHKIISNPKRLDEVDMKAQKNFEELEKDIDAQDDNIPTQAANPAAYWKNKMGATSSSLREYDFSIDEEDEKFEVGKINLIKRTPTDGDDQQQVEQLQTLNTETDEMLVPNSARSQMDTQRKLLKDVKGIIIKEEEEDKSSGTGGGGGGQQQQRRFFARDKIRSLTKKKTTFGRDPNPVQLQDYNTPEHEERKKKLRFKIQENISPNKLKKKNKKKQLQGNERNESSVLDDDEEFEQIGIQGDGGVRGGGNYKPINILQNIKNLSTHQSTASLSSSANSFFSKIEEAIHNTQTEFSLKVLNTSVIGHMVLSIAIILYYIIFGQAKIDALPKVLDIATHNFWTHYWLTIGFYWNTNLISMWLTDTSRARFNESGVPYYHWILGWFPNEGIGHTNYSSLIKQNINLLETETQDKFFRELVEVQRYDQSQTQKKNFFQMSSALSNSVWRLAVYKQIPTVALQANDPDIRYILNNCLDDMLIQTENNYVYVKDDVEMKLKSLETIILILDFAIVLLGVFIFAVTVYNEARFLTRRKYFVEQFIRIKNDEIDPHISLTKRFQSALQKVQSVEWIIRDIYATNPNPQANQRNNNGANVQNKAIAAAKQRSKEIMKTNVGLRNGRASQFQSNTREQQGFSQSYSSSFSSDGQRNRRRQASKSPSLKGFNTAIYRSLIYVVFFQALILSLCLGIYFIFLEGKKNIEKQSNRAAENSKIFGKFGTIFLTLYQYIGEQESFTLRNQPFTEEWDRDYIYVAESVEFFNSLRDSKDPAYLQKLETVLLGDLCQHLYNGGCSVFVKEESRHGLLGVNGYIIETVRNMKDTFDRSNKTKEARREALMIDRSFKVEWLYWLFSPVAFQELEGLLKQSIVDSINDFKVKNLIMISTFSGCFLLFLRLIWVPILKLFYKERFMMQSMFRSVPVHVVLTNTSVKNYLMQTTGKALKAIQHTI